MSETIISDEMVAELVYKTVCREDFEVEEIAFTCQCQECSKRRRAILTRALPVDRADDISEMKAVRVMNRVYDTLTMNNMLHKVTP